MKLSDDEIETVDKMIAAARKKNYHEDTIEILIMLCYAVTMKENGYMPMEAMKKIVGFIQESPTSQDCLERALNLAGVE